MLPPPLGSCDLCGWIVAGFEENLAADCFALFPGHQFISPDAGISRRWRDQPGIFCELLLDPFSPGFQEVAQAAFLAAPARGPGVFAVPIPIRVSFTAADRAGRLYRWVRGACTASQQVLAYGFDGFTIRRAAGTFLVFGNPVKARVTSRTKIYQVLRSLNRDT